MLSKKTFAAGIALLASVYEKLERITTDKFLSEQWYKMLSDLTDAQFRYAIEIIVKTQKFAPTISEIREKAVEYNHQAELSAEEAWALVYSDIHAKGYYNEPHYEDWKLEAAKNAIGWQTLCDMTENEKGVIRAHFMRIYDSLKQREKTAETIQSPQLQQLVSVLVGTLAPAAKPVLTPNKKKALTKGA
ncbi:hypothetical protein SU69_07475 [Thermosipho melanesiensis]|uniref:Replicative helicase inhibitor G39P N-terminal domain-containing protein n=2 Tax=Thermosipho melanesiensis TaxID=46541 RepID=A6LN16_THEM4|nr:hypothetical protein [Thermosipho melanesiensis]ABR31317.1 hypothetical protein Tmel_1470 [Thermosipho melanesiensis BI429]APT74386.1 hypothetical protein BW47_07825 [Thermosipho melanesiensis]OOC36341.1 hypothetical protein SU68_07545 [Thermosipho melanesiensis]OOC37159.1 hypothetical protein SU69_07475 [Thermosipho melanesiensis]OOC37911.1 hypothetical protein SU70_07485 [Thermosipho melanesiensis]